MFENPWCMWAILASATAAGNNVFNKATELVPDKNKDIIREARVSLANFLCVLGIFILIACSTAKRCAGDNNPKIIWITYLITLLATLTIGTLPYKQTISKLDISKKCVNKFVHSYRLYSIAILSFFFNI
ncbi:MAG: hypothetical protein JEZ07_18910 [Phycisphaerae bacterium]|nr:hypothetical protein [Phycisphaerae bacterium]